VLCQGQKAQFSQFVASIFALDFEQEPDYERLIELLTEAGKPALKPFIPMSQVFDDETYRDSEMTEDISPNQHVGGICTFEGFTPKQSTFKKDEA